MEPTKAEELANATMTRCCSRLAYGQKIYLKTARSGKRIAELGEVACCSKCDKAIGDVIHAEAPTRCGFRPLRIEEWMQSARTGPFYFVEENGRYVPEIRVKKQEIYNESDPSDS